jgi:hypothetical protein
VPPSAMMENRYWTDVIVPCPGIPLPSCDLQARLVVEDRRLLDTKLTSRRGGSRPGRSSRSCVTGLRCWSDTFRRREGLWAFDPRRNSPAEAGSLLRTQAGLTSNAGSNLAHAETRDAGEVAEIMRDNLEATRESRGGDLQIMRSDGLSRLPQIHRELSIDTSSGQIKRDDGERAQDPLDKGLSTVSSFFRVGEVDSSQQFTCGDGSKSNRILGQEGRG